MLLLDWAHSIQCSLQILAATKLRLHCIRILILRCTAEKMTVLSSRSKFDKNWWVGDFYQLIIIFNILGILYIYSENSLVAFMLHNMPCIFSKGIEKCQKLTTWDTFRQECWKSTSKKSIKLRHIFVDIFSEGVFVFLNTKYVKNQAQQRRKAALEKIWSHCVNCILKKNHHCSKNKFHC